MHATLVLALESEAGDSVSNPKPIAQQAYIRSSQKHNVAGEFSKEAYHTVDTEPFIKSQLTSRN